MHVQGGGRHVERGGVRHREKERGDGGLRERARGRNSIMQGEK